jgi:hypothetical protein
MKNPPVRLTLLLALSLLGLRCQDRHAQTRAYLAPAPTWALTAMAAAMPVAQPRTTDPQPTRTGTQHPASLLLNDGDQWLQASPPSPETASKARTPGNKPRDLTDSIKVAIGSRCPLRLIVEGNKVTAVYGIGLAEVLDDIEDPSNKQGAARPGLLDRQLRPRPRAHADLALAGAAAPDLSAVAPIATAARDMASPAWNPSCHCANLGRRVMYWERALYLVDGDTETLWVNLAGLNCEFCLDRIPGEFRITAQNAGCATAFRCDASTRCHW